MGLIKELRDDIVDSEKPLSGIMRKAKVLASMLKNEELKTWVDNELNGYSSQDDIPEYRQSTNESYGYFAGPFGSALKNFPIPTVNLPKKIQKIFEKTYHAQGIRGLESVLENDSPSFNVPWPADIIPFIQDKIYARYNCVSAWRVIGRSQIEQIIDTVRNKLLNFVIELMEKYPDIIEKEEAIADIPKDQITSVVTTNIFGSHNVIASGQYVNQTVIQDIRTNDIDSLLSYMKKVGVLEDDVAELKKAVESDGERKEKNRFGPKVIAWIGRMTQKVLEGIWKVGISAAPALLTKALEKYYGW